MIFLALKTEDGRITGKISFYCRMLGVSRQGFYKYLANKDRPWKYQDLADAMKEIVSLQFFRFLRSSCFYCLSLSSGVSQHANHSRKQAKASLRTE